MSSEIKGAIKEAVDLLREAKERLEEIRRAVDDFRENFTEDMLDTTEYIKACDTFDEIDYAVYSAQETINYAESAI